MPRTPARNAVRPFVGLVKGRRAPGTYGALIARTGTGSKADRVSQVFEPGELGIRTGHLKSPLPCVAMTSTRPSAVPERSPQFPGAVQPLFLRAKTAFALLKGSTGTIDPDRDRGKCGPGSAFPECCEARRKTGLEPWSKCASHSGVPERTPQAVEVAPLPDVGGLSYQHPQRC